MVTSERLSYLLEQLEAQSATSEEYSELRELLNADSTQSILARLQSIYPFEDTATTDSFFHDPYWQEILQQVLAADKTTPTADLESTAGNLSESPYSEYKDLSIVPPVPRTHFLKTAWFRYAAAIICLIATGAYLWFQSSREQAVTSNYKQLPVDIAPGKDGAILTLADGSQVVLDSLGNGIIATQNGTQVLLQDGQLSYDLTGKAAGGVVYNTMSTPKGRQFNLRLPDGTRVWLNSASSLRYPTAFSGATRQVEITGEAYFEVEKNARQPFILKIQDQAEIEVLGTSFNVNAYKEEESINTTLIEGSIRASVVSSDRLKDPENAILKPGQQAQIMNTLVGQNTQPGMKVINNANVDKIMAWKNGIFNFEDASLKDVMRQLERWYDIEVVYEKGIPDIRFGGKMSRGVSLRDLLKALQESEVHFRIEEGRRLVVMP